MSFHLGVTTPMTHLEQYRVMLHRPHVRVPLWSHSLQQPDMTRFIALWASLPRTTWGTAGGAPSTIEKEA
jgi:hypothetical protein